MEKCKSYIRYSTDAPIEFGEVIAIQTLGFALGPDVVNRIQPEALYHNSYSVFVGQSTFARKDTVQELLGETIVPIDYHLPKGGSPEAFLEEMCEHNSGFQFMGEWSRELKGVKTGNYLASFAEIKNDLIKPRRYRKRLVVKSGKKHEFTIDKPYLCINTTITPEVLKECITTEMMDGGYFARHIIVSGKIKPRKRGRLQQEALEIKNLLRNEWKFVEGLDKSDCVFELSDEALEYYNDVVEEEVLSEKFSRVRSSAGRYLDYVVTFADILLVSEALGELINYDRTKISKLVELVTLVKLVNNNIEQYTNPTNGINPTNATNLLTRSDGTQIMVVQKRHVEEAWRILKKCLYNALDVAEYVDMENPLARVRNYIMKHKGKKVEHSVALRNTNLTARKFADAIETLVGRNEVKNDKIEYINKEGKLCGKRAYVWIGRDE